jgi:hypothetical protein
MKAFEFFAEVDAQRRVQIALPPTVMPGTVRIIVLAQETDEEETDALWMQGVAREWADELADTRQDIYTLEDGEPIDAAR